MPGTLNDAEVAELLAAPEVAVLCTVDAGGAPEGSPVWFEASGAVIHVHVDRHSKKARNVRANSNVSLTIDTRTAPYRGVILRGTAREAAMDEVILKRIALRYLGPEIAEAYLASTRETSDTVRLEITVTSRHTWDYAKGF